MHPKMGDLIFTLKFEKGLADRNRLPLEQVIKILQEFRQMIIEAGREIRITCRGRCVRAMICAASGYFPPSFQP